MRVFVAAILAALLAGHPARADDVLEAAKVHLDRGIAAFDAKDYVRARHELAEARDLAPEKPNPYRWLALTDVQLGNCPEALLEIDAFLARVTATDPRRAELERLRRLCTEPLPRVTEDPKPPPPGGLPPPPPPHEHTSITHRWWFWTALAGVAVTATAVTLYARRSDTTENMLPPIKCDAIGCHP
jgi:hypothetical protein